MASAFPISVPLARSFLLKYRPRLRPARSLAAVVGGLWVLSAVASPQQQGSADWRVSDDGAYVIDVRAQLAWPRCVEGMQWNGTTCTGKPLLLDRAEATALATARWQAEGVAWRLPRAAELQRLVGKAAHNAAGADARLFAAAPDLWYWSSTANVSGVRGNQYNYNTIRQSREGDSAGQMALLNGWAVNMATGEARGDVARASKLPVRLVRPQMEPAR
ncbi:DUF1566 domain-containing protein [Acidovorax sp. FHTAMBA]|uniref:Lcl domain-containing protein n=1 Tax=Acidovorax sp. FHTAMBA TaxID=3140252 RepID=UPI00318367E0